MRQVRVKRHVIMVIAAAALFVAPLPTMADYTFIISGDPVAAADAAKVSVGKSTGISLEARFYTFMSSVGKAINSCPLSGLLIIFR